MARRYRVFGQGEWVSSSGNALVALYNPLASNKAIYVHSVEVHNVTRSAASTATSYAMFSIVRGVSAGGDAVAVATRDTAETLPTGVGVYRDAQWTSVEEHMRWAQYKRFAPAGVGLGVQFGPRGYVNGRGFNSVWNPPKTTDYEAITLRPGESAGLYVGALNASQVYLVNVTFDVDGGTNYNCAQYVRAIADNCGPLVLRNDSASDVVRLLTIGVQEVGTFDTPYMQLVPALIDPVSLADTTSHMAVGQFDSADDAFPGVVMANALAVPAGGIPVSYIAEGSAATPKGFNYIGTKDFVGPAWRAMFPETAGYGVSAGTLGNRCLVGLNNRRGNILGGRSAEPIVVRPGEAIALCSAAETATATTAVPVSGWSAFDFGLTMSVQDLVVPTITLTGLETGTRVCLVEAGTDTLVDIGDESGGEYSYTFDASPGDFVDIAILAAGFVYQKIPSVELLAAVQTIPVTQDADPIYDALLSEAVTFDAATTRIICDAGNTSLNVPATYTEWVEWALTANNLRYLHAFENQGGTEIDPGAGTSIPAYCYLVNSWRVRPQEANHTLAVTDGILLVSGGGDPFVNTLGSYVVRINYQQPVQAITVATGGGGGGTDWTSTEREQIRSRLGIDGSASAPAATPSLATATAVATVQTDVDTLEARLTAPRAANLDNLDAAVSSRAAPGDAMDLAADAVDAASLAASAVAEIQTGLATAAEVAAVKAKTDSLTFTQAGQVDVNVQFVNDVEVAGTGQTGNEWGPA